MIAVIGEKPSVARDIARILGANEKQDGYLSGNGYLVTWAFGHLVGLAMPEAYGIQSFRRESLPIIPDSFQLTPRQVKAEKGYKADPGALKQLKVIKDVFDPVSYTHLDVYKRQTMDSVSEKNNIPVKYPKAGIEYPVVGILDTGIADIDH